MDWKEVIRQWRALPDDEKHRRRWDSIPRSVALSCAAAGAPVDLGMLEAEHARHPMPRIGQVLEAPARPPSDACGGDIEADPS